MIGILRKLPVASALADTFSAGYDRHKLKADLIAGLVVSLVALPLAMALSIAVGLPPQNGLYTAIIAGIVAAVFGGSKTQVSGPTAAFVVIVAPIVAEYGMRGIVWCQIFAGLILLGLGISRLGKIITYVPYPVTTGFTSGIAVVIGTIALNDFFGVEKAPAGHWPQKVWALLESLPHMDPATLFIGTVALIIMIVLPRFKPKIPSAIAGIFVATILSLLMAKFGLTVETIGTRFTFTGLDGVLRHGVPSYPPVLHIPGLSQDPVFAMPSAMELSAWFVPSLVIAILAALESLLSATVADSMSGTRHDPNAELNGIGLGNIFSGLFLGIPATGAIARTATNINAGAVSPIASITHSILILIYMVCLAPLIAYIPMSALSALLMITAWRMSHAKQFIHLIKSAPRSDRAVTIVCFLMTVMIDMVAGVLSGLVLASLLFLKKMMDTTAVNYHHADNNQTEYVLPHGTMLLHFDGPLFFGTAEKVFNSRPDFLTDDIQKVILDMTSTGMIDVTALNLLEEFLRELKDDGKTVYICTTHGVSKAIHRRLSQELLGRVHFIARVSEAL